MNFATLRKLTIPEGEVAVIARGNEILWQKHSARLPAEYQEVAYLEGTGTQYLDTGKYAPVNTDIEVQFSLNSTAQGAVNNGCIFGGRTGTTSNTCTLFYLASTNPQYFRFDRTGQVQIGTAGEITIDANSIYEFSYRVNQITIKNLTTGEEASKTIGAPSSFATVPITLFAVNTNGTAGTFLKGKIYKWKYWANSELAQDLVPCYRKSDNKAGMYDLVTETFFTNKGTGEFLYEG